jgi:putative phosphoribosyl transferase
MNRFQGRADAGRYLADLLQKYAHKPNTIVLGLPSRGIVIAFEMEQGLGLAIASRKNTGAM